MILLFLYACLRVSSQCSRIEEEWQQQEYGKLKKDYKLMKKRGLNLALLHEVVSILANNESLPDKYKDHYLIGEYKRI